MSQRRGVTGRLTITTAAVVLFALASPEAFAANTPLSSCGSITTPGSYVLTKSLTVSGTCFTITVSNVAIDFKGHRISGDGTGDGIDDGGHGLQNIIIANGTIADFNVGVNFPTNPTDSDAMVTLDKMKVLGNASAGIVIKGCCNTVTNSKVNDNGTDGIDILNCCNTFSNIQVRDNKDLGVFASGCCHFMNNSNVSDNGSDGADLEGGDSTIISTVMTNNVGNGTFMDGCCNSLTNSTVNRNEADGAILTGGFNMIVGSKAIGNTKIGFDLSAGKDDFNTVSNCQAKGNNIGVDVLCPGNVLNLFASGNSGGNLIESGGPCTNLNNRAR